MCDLCVLCSSDCTKNYLVKKNICCKLLIVIEKDTKLLKIK